MCYLGNERGGAVNLRVSVKEVGLKESCGCQLGTSFDKISDN